MTRYDFLASAPTDETAAGRGLAALLANADGRRAAMLVTVEISNEAGARVHQTLALKPWADSKGRAMLSVEVHGSGSWERGIKAIRVAVVSVETGRYSQARDERGQAPLLQYAAYAALRFVWTGEVPSPTNGMVEVTMEERCVRCQSPLTDPESKRRMLGPECAGKETGTRTIVSASRPRGAAVA